jgi:serine phosphatase RsbU (regulator of sigma subunit)
MGLAIRALNARYASMCLALLKFDGFRVSASAAGMPPLLIYRAASRSVEELIMEGMPLGSSSLANYREYFTDLEPGDILLLSSDGLPESVDGSERLLGYDAVQESFRKAAARGAMPERCVTLSCKRL